MALQVDARTHYDPICEQLKKETSLIVRKQMETQHVKELRNRCQNRWDTYYYISAEWTHKWQRYIAARDESNLEPPGPVANTEIMFDLCNASNEYDSDSDLEEEQKFFFINKDLFYFFISLYGGGPAIVQINDFERHDLNGLKCSAAESSPPRAKAGGFSQGIVGLRNESNYCYMNACLQCLIAIDELRDYYN